MEKIMAVKSTEKNSQSDQKSNALQAALTQIERSFGKGAVMKMSGGEQSSIPAISTGSIGLDIALGIGGLPRGRIVEIYGPESSGKTSLTLHVVAEAQKLGGTCAFIDAEHALDPVYASKLGVNLDDLLISQPDNGEQAMEITDTLVRSGAVDVIVVDSVAALTPRAELEGDMGDSHMGLHARLMSQALRKLTGAVSRSNTLVLFINQLRCVDKDTYVYGQNGLVQIKDIVVGDYVLNPDGDFKRVNDVINSGRIPGRHLHIRFQPDLKISDNHRQIILDPTGNHVEKLGNTVNIGDWLVYPISNVDAEPRNKNINLSSFLGMYMADGYIHEYDRNGQTNFFISFTENNDERRELVYNTASKIFGVEQGTINKVALGKNYVRVGGGRQNIDFLKNTGCGIIGQNKTIPHMVLSGSKQDKIKFLQGASFDTHGFNQNGFIWSFDGIGQAELFSLLLKEFGIFADIRKDKKDWYNRLYISGYDAVRYAELIGFAEDKKTLLAQAFKNDIGARGKYDLVPGNVASHIFAIIKEAKTKGMSGFRYYNSLKMCFFKNLNVSRTRFLDFCEDAICSNPDLAIKLNSAMENLRKNRYAQITNIDNVNIECMDIDVDGELFIANGAVTHNSKIGVMYGPNETTTGGNALKFYASVRLDIRRTGSIKDKEEVVGNQTRVKVVKNKVSPPFRQVEFEIIYGEGISRLGELVDMGVAGNIIEKSGAWYSYDSQRIGQGKENVKRYLREHPEVATQIEHAIRNGKDAINEKLMTSPDSDDGWDAD